MGNTLRLPPFNPNILNRGALETDRLVLKPLVKEHLDLIVQHLFKDDDVMHYVGSYDQALSKQPYYIQHWKNYGFGFYTLFHKLTNKFIGRAGLFIAESPPEIELGYTIQKEFWGQGYATEASQACIQHGFDEVQAELITATVIPENTPSARVAEKVGMVQCGTCTSWGKENHLYVITRQNYTESTT